MTLFNFKAAVIAGVSAAALAACGVNTEANAVPQDSQPVVSSTEATVAELPSGEYIMDKTHGYVVFSYDHLGFSKPILRFDDIDAVLTLDSTDPTQSKVSVKIDPASINSGVARFDEHLVGEDFFNVAKFPTITFESSDLSQLSSSKGTLTGNLTMKGITKPVTLNVTLNKAGENFRSGNPQAGFSAKGTLNRSDFDLGAYVPNVSDAVELIIEAEFGKQ